MRLASVTITDNFSRYVRLFCQLYSQIQSASGDDDKADAIRDEMDRPWRQLTSDEFSFANELAIDLSHLTEERDPPTELRRDVLHQFRNVKDSQDWRALLAFLRAHEDKLPLADVSALRGICWMELGQPFPAVLFMADAVRRRPSDLRLKWHLLRYRLQAEQYEQARSEALALAGRGASPLELLLAADVLFDCISILGGDNTTGELAKIVEIAARGASALPNSPRGSWQNCVAGAGLLSQALSFELLGEQQNAITAAKKAFEILPERVDSQNGVEPESCQKGNGAFRSTIVEKRAEAHRDIFNPHKSLSLVGA